MSTAISEAIYQQYLALLLDGDRHGCASLVEQSRAGGAGLKELYLDLFQRSLYQVGDLWEQHLISVAVEHLATAITERVMTLVQPALFGGSPRERSLLVCCVADEFHRVGGQMVADLAELHGWRGYFLGPDNSVDTLLKTIDHLKPDRVGLSLSVAANLPSLYRAADAVQGTFPGLPVLVGGQALRPRWGALAALRGRSGVGLVTTPEELEKELAAHELR